MKPGRGATEVRLCLHRFGGAAMERVTAMEGGARTHVSDHSLAQRCSLLRPVGGPPFNRLPQGLMKGEKQKSSLL